VTRGPELTIAQVADLCNVSRSTVRGWIHRGNVTARRGMVDGASLIAYLDRRGTHGQHK